MKKSTALLLLDALLSVLFFLMFYKFAVTLKFHEVFGLALLGLMVVHIAIHPRYVANLFKKAFSSGINKKTRIGYIVNILLGICVIVMLISSLMISKIIFSFHGAGYWETIHLTTAAIMLVLVGIHLGLHFNMIARRLHLPKILATLLISTILAFGVYSLVSSRFLSFLAAPFRNGTEEFRGEGQGRGSGRNHSEGTLTSPLEVIQWDDTIMTFLTYGSITYVFAFAAAKVADGISKRKKKLQGPSVQ
jgi:cytochrome b561